MIFVTVGTQLPFDRLIRTVDQWAGRAGRADVLAQAGPSSYQARFIRTVPFLKADECYRLTGQAAVVVAHAGMGSILTALELGKPIIVMPRRGGLGEHRNDHQVATARQLFARGKVLVAWDEEHLLDKLASVEALRPHARISQSASPQLVDAIRAFLQADRGPRRAAVPYPSTAYADLGPGDGRFTARPAAAPAFGMAERGSAAVAEA